MATATAKDPQPSRLHTWVMDSGASHNFTPNLSDFEGPLVRPKSSTVRIGDGRVLSVTSMGQVRVLGQNSKELKLTGVHHVPDIHSTLLSVTHLTRVGLQVVFNKTGCKVLRGQVLLMEGGSEDGGSGLPRIHLPIISREQAVAYIATTVVPLSVAHQRLAHASPSTIQKLVTNNYATGLQVAPAEGELVCQPCLMGKASKLPFPKVSPTAAEHPLELIHVDLWGPARTPTLGKQSLYVLSILDHFSSYTWVKFLKTKEAAGILEALSKWLAHAERQTGHKLKCIRTDNGIEFKGEVGE